MARSKDSYIDLLKSGSPDAADVYTVPELTEVSVGYMLENADDFVHTTFGPVEVSKQTGKYRRYKPGAFFRNKMEKRTDGAESAGGGYETEMLDFSTDVWAWHTDVGPQMRANAAGTVDVEMAATELCSNAALINAEVEWTATYFKTGIWSTELTFDASPAPGQFLSWMDDDSDPIADQRAALKAQRKRAVGKRANVIVYSEDVWERLLVHPLLRVLWGGGQTPGGPVLGDPAMFKSQLAKLLEVQEIKVAKALYTTSNDGDPTETFDVIVPTGVGMFYRPARPSVMTPAAGYTFNWTGYAGAGSQGQVITRETIPLTKGATRYEIERAYGFELVSADCGAWLEGVLDT